ncbi:hypothetical protein MSAN_01721100 [Mycena sanguinolenta]|uniref:Uncharacterized protein n=1 Tax=Mycena sanguinolenta TaxID=230812 RepID=A0A8H7CVA5_9AGAR|nr:hypothetical protein MSAN_01721100 [Mycena sanguinolenta]
MTIARWTTVLNGSKCPISSLFQRASEQPPANHGNNLSPLQNQTILCHFRVTSNFADSRLIKAMNGVRNQEPALPLTCDLGSTHGLVHSWFHPARQFRREPPGFVPQKIQFAANDKNVFRQRVAGRVQGAEQRIAILLSYWLVAPLKS